MRQHLCFALFLAASLLGFAQTELQTRVVFWNVENLFDTFDDSLTWDEEFTPTGTRHWNGRKYANKLQKVSKTLIALGEWKGCDIIGLAEVENRFVLNDLLGQTALKKEGYQIIHRESQDFRGIDVAIMYKADAFKPYHSTFITVHLPDTSRTTREVILSSGTLANGDTLHVMMNHWPSRYGGQMRSMPAREAAAKTVRNAVDSILAIQNNARILIMGDFNDEPIDESLAIHLEAAPFNEQGGKSLINLSTQLKNGGTHKYQGQWGVLDQIIVSRSLIEESNSTSIPPNQDLVYKADFLIEDDATHLGKKPNRTFVGFKYNGGYSDHLPIYIDLQSTK